MVREIRNVNSVLSTVIMNHLLQEFTQLFSAPCNTKITVNVVKCIYNFVIFGKDVCKKHTQTTKWSCIPVMFKKEVDMCNDFTIETKQS